MLKTVPSAINIELASGIYRLILSTNIHVLLMAIYLNSMQWTNLGVKWTLRKCQGFLRSNIAFNYYILLRFVLFL